MKQQIYIKSWNGFSPDSSSQNSDFSGFYEKYYDSKKNINMSSDWFQQKKTIAKDLSILLKSHKKILSMGCGKGILEKFILDELDSDNFIHGIDPYIDSKTELQSKSLRIQKCSVFCKSLKNFDIAFMNTVDYCLNDNEYISIAKRMKELSKNGIILSQLMIPNIEYLLSWRYKVSTFIKTLPVTPYVFWGWHRTVDEHILLLRKCGFKRITLGFHSSDSMWIYAN